MTNRNHYKANTTAQQEQIPYKVKNSTAIIASQGHRVMLIGLITCISFLIEIDRYHNDDEHCDTNEFGFSMCDS